MQRLVLFLVCIFSLSVFARESSCGSIKLVEKHREKKLVSAMTHASGETFGEACAAEYFYEDVRNEVSPHFQVFYTLEGPHKTTLDYVDTLIEVLENAYEFHTKKMGMRPPLGQSETYHYQQPVLAGHYPVEIIDFSLIRDPDDLFGVGNNCNSCYGLTIPSEENLEESTLLMENDFKFPTSIRNRDSVEKDGTTCTYAKADRSLRNETYGYSYDSLWANGIKVTAYHELYHAIQQRYLSFYEVEDNNLFWYEASAAAIEEISAPDIDDYFSYVSKFLAYTGNPIQEFKAPRYQSYGAGVLLLYLYNHFDKQADRLIWENMEKNPQQDFYTRLNKIAEKKKVNGDSLFHDFAKALAFTGRRAKMIDSSLWIHSDQNRWPSMKYYFTEDFTNSPEPFSYNYYSGTSLGANSLKATVSAAVFKDSKAEFVSIIDSKTMDSLTTEAVQYDSVLWVLSNLTSQKEIPILASDSTIRAFPTPWRPGHNLCFTPLPAKKKFIEIRNRRGDLVLREKYDSDETTHCIEEKRVKNIFTPGVYGFRFGSSGKQKNMMIIY